jgi:serine/threonine-protein kinase
MDSHRVRCSALLDGPTAGTRRALRTAMRVDFPERVRDYILDTELGAGGLGRVFAARDAKGAAVAVKLLHPELATDACFAARLHDEARLARMVSHRNVVRMLESGTTGDGVPYLVMRRAAGVSLGALVRTLGPLPMARVRRIATQILEGLVAIHAAGLVHGDLKADNVLVADDDRVTIIDFGLAREHAVAPAWLADGVVSGTPEYMAPEVIAGGPMTSAADIYAAGVIIYELLTGTTPFAGGSTAVICERHLTETAVPPSLRYPERALPVALEALLMRALAKQPAQRHLNAALFATGIARAIPTTWPDAPSARPLPARMTTVVPTRRWEIRCETVRPVRFADGTGNHTTATIAGNKPRQRA